MASLDVVMVGPFPTDAARIEGGVQASLWGLAVALRERPEIASIRVVATPHRPIAALERRTVSDIDVLFLDTPFGLQWSAALRLPAVLAEIRRAPTPLVHLHGSGIVQAAALVALRFGRVPVVWTMHGITEKELAAARRRAPGFKSFARWALYTLCERLLLRFSPKIVVDTPYVAAEVGGRAGVAPRAVPQGIFPDEIAAARNPARTEPRALALGVIHPRKGHDLTIRAFAEVAKRLPAARLTIVGSVADSGHLGELRSLIERLGLTGAVEILVDCPRDRVLEELRRARLFVLHSQEESQGIAICEAMAAGLPVVATRVGGIPDVVGDGGAGFLVAYGDTAAMAERMAALMTDDRLATQAGAAAMRRGADFGWDAIATTIAAIYEDAVRR